MERIAFPKVHSIERLVDLLPPSMSRPVELLAAAQLTEYATTFRYPGEAEPASKSDYREALGIAEAVFAWASERIHSG